MRCTSPRTVGYYSDGKTICWSPKKYSKEFPIFQLPCGKCLSCRLEYARQWAVRCVHEASTHEKNSFVTLTYDDLHIGDNRLQYRHFQEFIKRLREEIIREYIDNKFGNGHWHSLNPHEKSRFRKEHKNELQKVKISYFVTGEYGSQTKRAHWHALLFNYRPSDLNYKFSNDRGDKTYESESLKKIWGMGDVLIGEITFESAGYCARYAAKKLTHGKDDEHDFVPISKKSSHSAIGKTFLERYWTDVFTLGQIVLPNGHTCPIPRYYEKWLQKNRPADWIGYVTQKKQDILEKALQQKMVEHDHEKRTNEERASRQGAQRKNQITRLEQKKKIIEHKFNETNKHLKL